MMYFEPEHSPWGQVDHCETICPGVYSVSTPSHGGIMIRSDRAAEILSPSARRIGFREHGYLCFEEDCDAPVALRELMDRGLMDTPVNNHLRPVNTAGSSMKAFSGGIRNTGPITKRG